MFADQLIQYRISPWSKAAEKRSFCRGITDERMDGQTDRSSYRDVILMDASKNLAPQCNR